MRDVHVLVALMILLAANCSSAAEESEIRGCPRENWPGPWTACAEARWVGRVVEAGGYWVGSIATGSALSAGGHGRAFYVWAACGGASDSDP